ncbi:hypothetical protein [Micromonospora sp. WMMA1363]|uniref:hypothetical protein n=1 Tax=Micromonospora sp. WMMA1363 TaxID=3053985 RepID=UPI00338D6DF9
MRAATLSASPYQTRQGTRKTQNTHLYETANGAVVFASGTLCWTRALNRRGWRDKRIEVATTNLLDRIIGESAATAISVE